MTAIIDSVFESTGSSWGHTVGAGQNRLLLVYVTTSPPLDSDSVTVDDAVGNPIAMSLILRQVQGTHFQQEIWALVNPPSGVHKVRVNTQSIAGTVFANSSISFSSVDQAHPILNPSGASALAGGSVFTGLAQLSAPVASGDELLIGTCVWSVQSTTQQPTACTSDQTRLLLVANSSPQVFALADSATGFGQFCWGGIGVLHSPYLATAVGIAGSVAPPPPPVGGGMNIGLLALLAAAAVILVAMGSGQDCDQQCYKIIDPVQRANCVQREQECYAAQARRQQDVGSRRY